MNNPFEPRRCTNCTALLGVTEVYHCNKCYFLYEFPELHCSACNERSTDLHPELNICFGCFKEQKPSTTNPYAIMLNQLQNAYYKKEQMN